MGFACQIRDTLKWITNSFNPNLVTTITNEDLLAKQNSTTHPQIHGSEKIRRKDCFYNKQNYKFIF